MLSFINLTFVDILQLLSGCMHPMLSITGSIVCQFYVSFTSVCVCMCSCLFFMKSLTHDFDYIDNFVTLVCWKDSSHSKSNFKNKQFKQGFAGTTLLNVAAHTNNLQKFTKRNAYDRDSFVFVKRSKFNQLECVCVCVL